MQTCKRILALVLVLVLAASNLPWSVMAAELGAAAPSAQMLEQSAVEAPGSQQTQTDNVKEPLKAEVGEHHSIPAESVAEIPSIVCDEGIVLTTDTDGGVGVFSFVPAADGTYAFFSYDNDYLDTYGRILDADMNELNSDDQGGGNNNFKAIYSLTAGTQYYLEARPYFSDHTGTYSVKVIQLVPATSVTISPDEDIQHYEGEGAGVSVVFGPDNAAPESVTWTSSDPEVATVDEWGYIHGRKAGTATITVTSESGLTDTVTVVVKAVSVLAEDSSCNITISNGNTVPTRFIPERSGNYRFYYTDLSGDGSDVYFNLYDEEDNWMGGSERYLDCYLETGEEYTIYTTFNGYIGSGNGSYTLYVTQIPAAESVQIDQGDAVSEFEGETIYLSATFGPENCMTESVTWVSDNTDVATVNESGTVKLVAPGTATITVTSANGLTDSITVTTEAATLLLLGEEKTGFFDAECILELFKFTAAEAGTYGVTVEATYGVDFAATSSGGDKWAQIYDACGIRTNVVIQEGDSCYFRVNRHSSGEPFNFTIKVEKKVPATGMEIAQGETISGYQGETCGPLSVKYAPDAAITENVTWVSDNTDVATVNESGYVKLVAPGTAVITATSENGLTDSITVTVIQPPSIACDEEKVLTTDTDNGEGVFSFVPAADGTYAFFSYDNNGFDTYGYILDADVNVLSENDQSGDNNNFKVIHSLTAGTQYYLKSRPYDSDDTGTYRVKVIQLVPATSVTISPDEDIQLYEGSGWGVSATFAPDNAAPESITWTSSNPEVATVDEWGNINAVSAGTATITVTSESGLTDSVTVVVKAYPVLTEDSPCNVTISNGNTEPIRFIPERSGNYRIYYTDLSGDGSNVSFDVYGDDGFVGYRSQYLDCYLETGKKYMIYTGFSSWHSPGNGTYTVHIAEIPAAESVQIDQGDAISGFKGDHVGLSVTFAPEICMTESVAWSSDNSDIATVDGDGYVRFLSVGTATITVTSENGLTDSITVTVESYPEIREGVETEAQIEEGGAYAYFSFTPEESSYYAFYSSGENDTYGYIMDEDLVVLAYNDDSGDSTNFKVKLQMEAGKTYILRARFYNGSRTGTFTVCVEKTKYVSALEVTSLPTRLNYVKGYVDEDEISYKGLKLKATWSDGSVTNWSCWGEDYSEMIGDERLSFDTSNCATTGEIILSCCGQKASFHINLIDDPVDHIEVVSPTAYKYVENYNGYQKSDGSFFYYFNTPTDAVIKIVYLDGTSVTANVDDVVDYYRINWSHDQNETAWVVGTENRSTVTYLGHTVNLPITVEKNPVESIEVVSGKVTCIENAYGYELSDGYYYYYTVPSDVTVKVNYTDGTSEVANIHNVLNDHEFAWDSDQYSEHWVLGDDNYLTVYYLGMTCKLPVSVIPSPVDHIVINSAPTREYIFGDREWGYFYDFEEGGDTDCYEFRPNDMTGLSFTVYYKDGTTKTYTDDDIYDGDQIDGYGYSLSYDECVYEIADIPVTFSYMGKSADYTVKMKESPVESLHMTKLPDVTQYDRYFSADFIGAEFTITYKDGTTKSVVITEDNFEYGDWMWASGIKVDIDGHPLMIYSGYGDEGYMGYDAYYIDKRSESIEIAVSYEKVIASVEFSNVSATGDNMGVSVTYEDGTTENLRMDVLECWSYEEDDLVGYEGNARTAKGIVSYCVETITDQDGAITHCRVYMFGRSWIVDATASVVSGDTNGDGVLERYASLSEAIEAAPANTTLQLLADIREDITVNKSLTLDLNGFDVTGAVTVGGDYTLALKDSRTDDYTVEDADGYGQLTNVSGKVVAADGYMMVTQQTGVSAHKVDLAITDEVLRPSTVSVYYKSRFAGDEIVAQRVRKYGVALSLIGAPTADALGLCSVYAGRFAPGLDGNGANGTLLYGIMKTANTEVRNENNAKMSVYGRPYILTKDGQYIFGECVNRSLREQVELIDAQWRQLTTSQKNAVISMYETYEPIISKWDVPNIRAAVNPGDDVGEKVNLTLGMPDRVAVQNYEENALTYWVEEQCNTDLSFVLYSGSTDIGTQISTTIAAGQELPDILFGVGLGEEVYRGYGRDGYFLDLTPYFEDKEGASKTFWTRLEENFTQAEINDIMRKITDPNTGKIYGVPTMDTTMVDPMDYQMWINTEWLDYLNLDMPTDLVSLYNVLKAFKERDPNRNGRADEIALYGGQEAGLGADVVNWLVNMFLYFNDRKNFSIDEDGQVYAPFITDEYREALKFINKLIEEGLMLDSVFNTKMSEMPMLTTPASGTAIIGCFAGHLTIHTDYNNPIMQQYKSLPLWSCAVFNDQNCRVNNFITADCEDPDKAFELMMTLWSEEGSRRVRYGEYGVNWTDPDEGAVSDIGLPASFKLIQDPMYQRNTCLWSSASCTLLVWAELEDAQLDTELSTGEAAKQKMHSESYANFKAAAEKYNPAADRICPTLVLTEEEKEDTMEQRVSCADFYMRSRTDFCIGDLDPNSDADWNAYVDTLWDLGLQDWLDVAQVAYDRG